MPSGLTAQRRVGTARRLPLATAPAIIRGMFASASDTTP